MSDLFSELFFLKQYFKGEDTTVQPLTHEKLLDLIETYKTQSSELIENLSEVADKYEKYNNKGEVVEEEVTDEQEEKAGET